VVLYLSHVVKDSCLCFHPLFAYAKLGGPGQKPTGDVVSFTYDELYAEVSSVLDKMGSNEFEELVRIAQVVVTHTLMLAGEIR
jgi:hypothetical protein